MGAAVPTAAPQRWQNLAPGLSSAAQAEQVAPASGAPQLEQYLPVAAAPQEEQGVDCGEVIRLKIPTCRDLRIGLTATYDYRLGALGGAAGGFVLKRDAYEFQPGAPSRSAHRPKLVVVSGS